MASVPGLADVTRDERRRFRRAIGVVRLVSIAPIVLAVGVTAEDPEAIWRLSIVLAVALLPALTIIRLLEQRRPSNLWWVPEAMVDATLAYVVVVAEPEAVVIAGGLSALVALVRTYGDSVVAGLVSGAGFALAAYVAADGVVPDQWVAAATLGIALGAGIAGQLTRFRGEAVRRLDTAARKAEALLTASMESVVVTTPYGVVRQANFAAEHMFPGCDGGVGGGCADVLALHRDITTLDCSGGCALLSRTFAGDAETEVWIEPADGERTILLATASPLVDDVGRVREVVHSFHDITALREADQAKSLFLATTSHELKTPLTVISGFVQLLQEDSLDSAMAQSALEVVAQRTAELQVIVDRFLLTSRIENGRIFLEHVPLDLAESVADRAQTLATAMARSIDVKVGDDLPPTSGDRSALATVLDHLIENACKYSADDTPVEVFTAVTDAEVHITVRDQGIGMSHHEVKQCFDRFWRADEVSTQGTGVGLYVVRSLMESMGGKVLVDSQPGAGSSFTLAIGRADREPEVVVDEAHGTEPLPPKEPSIVREFMRQIVAPKEAGS